MTTPPSKLALITLVSAATTTAGCYSTWDLTPQGVVGLNMFREGQAATVRSEDWENVTVTSSTKLVFRRIDGEQQEHQFRSITVDGPYFSGIDASDGSEVNIDLRQLKLVQARNLSIGKTALLTTGIAAGALVTGVVFLYAVTATTTIAGRPLHANGCENPVGADLMFDLDPRISLRSPAARNLDDATRQRILMHWARAASTECASIPAFMALARDLRRASAPNSLVRAALRAAREEAVHTSLCTNLVNALGDHPMRAVVPETPTPNDASLDALLERLALESFWDGCVGEGSAATSAQHAESKTRDNATRLAQQTIAQDEAGHAELSRDILAFCISAGGRKVRHALGENLERKRFEEENRLSLPITSSDSEVDHDALAAYGVPSEQALLAARAETWESSRKLAALV